MSVQVKLTELMHPQFMKSCSKYSSLEELFDASKFKIESVEDFEAIPDDQWDVFIKENTTYDNWLEMQKSAASAYAEKAIKEALK